MRPILKLENLNAGEQLKYSDQSELCFRLINEKKPVSYVGESATVLLKNSRGEIEFSQTVKVTEDNEVTFSIDQPLNVGHYALEVIVGRQYFPSDELTKIRIVQSSAREIEREAKLYGVEAIKQDVLKSTLKNIGDEVAKHITNMNEARVVQQQVPLAEWEVVHDLDSYPVVTIIDSSGEEVIGDITYISKQKLKVNFTSEFSGKVILTN